MALVSFRTINYNPNHDGATGRFSSGGGSVYGDSFQPKSLGIKVVATDKLNSIYESGDKPVYDYKKDVYLALKDKTPSRTFHQYPEEPKIPKEATSKNIDNLSTDEIQAISDYTSEYGYGSYHDVNEYLRTGNKQGVNEKTIASAENLKSAFKYAQLGADTYVYRGTDTEMFSDPKIVNAIKTANNMAKTGGLKKDAKSLEPLNSLKGMVLTDKAPLSTSPYGSQFLSNRDVKITIKTKKTDKAMLINDLSNYGKQDTSLAFLGTKMLESEVLYAPNTSFVIKDTQVTTSGVNILMETTNSKSSNTIALNYNPNHDESGRFSAGQGGKSSKLKDVIVDKKGTIYYHGTTEENAKSILKNGFDNSKNKKGYAESPYATFLSRQTSSDDDHSAGVYGDVILKIKAKKDILFLDANSKTWLDTMGLSTGSDSSKEWADKLKKLGYDGISENNGEITIWNTQLLEVVSIDNTSTFKNYSPSQPRDADGRWGGGSSSTKHSKYTPKQYTEFVEKEYGNMTSFNRTEGAEIADYLDSGYQYTNADLIEGKPLDDYRKITVKTLDKAMRHKLKEDTTLYRGIVVRDGIGDGEVIKYKGYSSTSINKESAKKFMNDTLDVNKRFLMKINAKKGQKGIFTYLGQQSNIDKTLASQEQEFLLPRKLDMKVDKINKKDGYTELEMSIL